MNGGRACRLAEGADFDLAALDLALRQQPVDPGAFDEEAAAGDFLRRFTDVGGEVDGLGFRQGIAIPLRFIRRRFGGEAALPQVGDLATRSEEHTSELQSQSNLVCRLLLEK